MTNLMMCEFNSCELLNGLIVGIITSGIVAWLTTLIVNRKDTKYQKSKFGVAEGLYNGYGFEKVDPNNPNSGEKTTLSDKIISQAKIIYQGENRLKIELKHDNLIWEGEILMESASLGSVAWRYINMPPENGKDQLLFGLKKCIVRNVQNEDKVYVYLIGDKTEGYSREILIRNK